MKTRIIRAPDAVKYGVNVSVFLAGTIDNGSGSDWYSKITNEFSSYVDFIIPRRLKWETNPSKQLLEEQIDWELNAIGDCDVVCFYFEDDSKSPITLLELGLCLASHKRIIVYCTDKFYRHQNVLQTCAMYGVKLHTSVESLNDALKKIIVEYPVR